ncbi:MAG: hypothetical protein ACK475_09010 [Bacteroidota bacterium]|jgi:hypothetical protein
MSGDASAPEKKTPVIPIVMGVVFGAVLLMLVLNGGMCERYNRKMERQRQMREYLESQRRR